MPGLSVTFSSFFACSRALDAFSVTFSSFFSCPRAQRRFLCYLFFFLFMLSGTETLSLLPFLLSFRALGYRDAFSVTFSSFFSCSRAQRRFLCYLFFFLFMLSGAETLSLLPFLLSFRALGHRDAFSVTFSSFFSCPRAQRCFLCYLFFFFSCYRAQRRFLCYLFFFLFMPSGTETLSLLPFLLSFHAIGHRERLSPYNCVKRKESN